MTNLQTQTAEFQFQKQADVLGCVAWPWGMQCELALPLVLLGVTEEPPSFLFFNFRAQEGGGADGGEGQAHEARSHDPDVRT